MNKQRRDNIKEKNQITINRSHTYNQCQNQQRDELTKPYQTTHKEIQYQKYFQIRRIVYPPLNTKLSREAHKQKQNNSPELHNIFLVNLLLSPKVELKCLVLNMVWTLITGRIHRLLLILTTMSSSSLQPNSKKYIHYLWKCCKWKSFTFFCNG
jgi:hypothetical protein